MPNFIDETSKDFNKVEILRVWYIDQDDEQDGQDNQDGKVIILEPLSAATTIEPNVLIELYIQKPIYYSFILYTNDLLFSIYFITGILISLKKLGRSWGPRYYLPTTNKLKLSFKAVIFRTLWMMFIYPCYYLISLLLKLFIKD